MPVAEARGEVRKLLPVFAGGGFVEDLAQAVNVRLRTAGAFGRDVALGAHERLGAAQVGDQARHPPVSVVPPRR